MILCYYVILILGEYIYMHYIITRLFQMQEQEECPFNIQGDTDHDSPQGCCAVQQGDSDSQGKYREGMLAIILWNVKFHSLIASICL